MQSWVIEEIVVIPVIGAVVVTVIRQIGAHLRAKAKLSVNSQYQGIAERAVASQEAAQNALAELQARITKIERVLLEVE